MKESEIVELALRRVASSPLTSFELHELVRRVADEINTINKELAE